ncbi:hypothetical protein Ctob_013686, partial [Chrysochromulina tobinii]
MVSRISPSGVNSSRRRRASSSPSSPDDARCRRAHHHRRAAGARGQYLCPNTCMLPPGRAASTCAQIHAWCRRGARPVPVPECMHVLGRRGRAREVRTMLPRDWRLRQVACLWRRGVECPHLCILAAHVSHTCSLHTCRNDACGFDCMQALAHRPHTVRGGACAR